ncbi:glycyl-radical enzyme activating protein [Megamonas funiformis]|uniref:glycyl-radical enzyme activating protein n=1 Tax=Megamonas funiformis TaxID=437897 RepID=UPI0022DFF6FB|nr:glycyl-radical enzyme activating protein [Megamonas funiformis]
MKGRIFNIQRFSIHDGPGIRTTVFFKGCNLRCSWCHNPESYRKNIEIQYQNSKCMLCYRCFNICPVGININENKNILNSQKCINCGKCVETCLYGARNLIGKDYDLDELKKIVLKDRKFFSNSNGGVTLSGGEVMLQIDFVLEFVKALKNENIHIAIDTAGNVSFDRFERLLPYVDLFLYDVKIMNDELHKKYIGVSNSLILENIIKLLKRGVNIEIRVPVISGINDNVENMLALKELIDKNVIDIRKKPKVRLLPYHNMGLDKASSIGIEMRTFKTPSNEQLHLLEDIFKEN